MARLPQIIYLHGLGSSPYSAKARLVGDRCRLLGHEVTIPSLALPSLEKLSVDRVVSHVRELIDHAAEFGDLFVIGSSFGGFAATHAYAAIGEKQRRAIRGLVLLAPVFYPWHATQRLLTPEVERLWQEQGTYPITESETGKNVAVHYEFVRELRSYNSDSIRLGVPTLIVHGTNDLTVSHQQSVDFAAQQSTVELILIEDDHQLLAAPDRLLERIEGFIQSHM